MMDADDFAISIRKYCFDYNSQTRWDSYKVLQAISITTMHFDTISFFEFKIRFDYLTSHMTSYLTVVKSLGILIDGYWYPLKG